MRRSLLAILLVLSVPSSALAADDPWIRADVPVHQEDWQYSWPRNCNPQPKDVLAMCSLFNLGNWKVHITGSGANDHYWASLQVFSVIDGGYDYADFYGEEPKANPSGTLPAYIFPLTPEGKGGAGLYALEVGFRDGSRYILLSTRNDGKQIDRASILDTHCPIQMKGVEHRTATERFFVTDYCAVSSVEALEFMAREALNRPPYATMEWIDNGEVKEK